MKCLLLWFGLRRCANLSVSGLTPLPYISLQKFDRNSIKESISSVESLVQNILGKKARLVS